MAQTGHWCLTDNLCTRHTVQEALIGSELVAEAEALLPYIAAYNNV